MITSLAESVGPPSLQPCPSVPPCCPSVPSCWCVQREGVQRSSRVGSEASEPAVVAVAGRWVVQAVRFDFQPAVLQLLLKEVSEWCCCVATCRHDLSHIVSLTFCCTRSCAGWDHGSAVRALCSATTGGPPAPGGGLATARVVAGRSPYPVASSNLSLIPQCAR